MKSELQILMLEDEISDAELIKKFLERSGLKFNAINNFFHKDPEYTKIFL